MHINWFIWIIFFMIVYDIQKLGVTIILQFSQRNGKLSSPCWKQGNYPVIPIYALPVSNNLSAQHWALLMIGFYLSTYLDGIIISISTTMLSTPYTFWILGPNSLIMSLRHINLWYSLRVAVYTIFLLSVNTFIS